MGVPIMTLEAKNLDKPDDVRAFNNGEIATVNTSAGVVGRGVFHPGWRWSNDMKPIVGTDSCELSHTGYVLSGHIHVRMNDGDEAEFGPGDTFNISPGHDAWVVGDESCEFLDWTGGGEIGRPASASQS